MWPNHCHSLCLSYSSLPIDTVRVSCRSDLGPNPWSILVPIANFYQAVQLVGLYLWTRLEARSICEHSVLATDSPRTRSECMAMQVWGAQSLINNWGPLLFIFLGRACDLGPTFLTVVRGARIFTGGARPPCPPLALALHTRSVASVSSVILVAKR